MAMIEIECPSCPQRMRIPTDKGPLTIRCETCGYVRKWERPPLIEVHTLDFRCGVNGQDFSIAYARLADDVDALFKRVGEQEATNANTSIEVKIRDRALVEVESAGHGSYLFVQSKPDSTYSMKNFDTKGWICTVCGYDAKESPYIFARCTKCKKLICGASIDVEKKPYRFTCNPECGYTYEIEETAEDKHINVEAHNLDIRGNLEDADLGVLQSVFNGQRTGQKKPALPKPTGSAIVPSPARNVTK